MSINAIHYVYYWSGIDQYGNRIRGSEFIANKHDLTKLLKQQNIIALKIIKIPLFLCKTNISAKAIYHLTRQIADLLATHIPIANAIEMLIKTSPLNNKLLLTRILNKLNNGATLADALADHPKYFDQIYRQLVYAGESSSTLEKIFRQLSHYLKTSLTLQQKFHRALYYPCTVAIIAIIVTYGLLVFVVPQFKIMFDNFNAPLPLITRLVINLATFTQNYGIWLFIIVLSLFLIYKQYHQHTQRITLLMQRLLLRIPLLKQVVITTQLTHWAQLLSTLLQNNTSLPTALQTANRCLTNTLLQTDCQQLEQSLRAGMTLHDGLNALIYMPTQIKQLIGAAEQANQLANTFTSIANQLQQQSQGLLANLSKLLEPAIMLILAVLTGILIIAMYLPVFNMGALV